MMEKRESGYNDVGMGHVRYNAGDRTSNKNSLGRMTEASTPPAVSVVCLGS